MTRPIDPTTELPLLRSKNQASELKLAFPESHIVFAALVDFTFLTTDSITEIQYDTPGSYDFNDILAGMTLWVGSSPGGYDLGIARIREDGVALVPATSSLIYIGETSDLSLMNPVGEIYLTVVDDFAPWARHLKMTSDTTCDMDWNVEYTDQNVKMNPVVNMGPDGIINVPGSVIDGGHPATIDFDATDPISFMPDGSVILSYVWSALGSGIALSGETTGTQTFTITQTGTWKVSCLITGVNGKTTTGWRTIVAFDQTHPPVNQFNLTQPPSGSKDGGGWSFEVTMWDQATIAQVRDRQQVILFARDWYEVNGVVTEVSLGPIQGRENVICIGWIAKESMHYDPNGASVTFTVEGPHYWLSKITGFILGIEDTDAVSTDWTEFNNLSVDKGLFMLMYWRSTIPFISDLFLTGDNRACPSIEAQQGSLWEQIKTNSWNTILANSMYNRYGQLYIEIDPQLVTTRPFPVVIDILKNDTELGTTELGREPPPQVSALSASGVGYAWGSGGIGTALLSYSPGHVFKQFGSPDTLEKIIVNDQAQLNEISGLYIAKSNNPYTDNRIKLVQNNRFIDICPRQYVHLQRDAIDTPRGIEFDRNIIPTTVTLPFDSKLGFMSCELNGEAEVFTDLSITGVIPVPNPPDDPQVPPIVFPKIPPVVWPGMTSKTYTFTPKNPISGGGVLGPRLKELHHALRIDAACLGGTSVTFNIEKRTSPSTTGVDIFAADLVAVPGGLSSLVFAQPALEADKWLYLRISGVSGVVTQLAVTLATTV